MEIKNNNWSITVFEWNESKNRLLKDMRNISFEDIVIAIENGNLIEVIDNPSWNFDNQKCYIVNINNYAYLIPFVIEENKVFLKTIFPSRKHTKFYLSNRKKYA